jgi:hypothetical protein
MERKLKVICGQCNQEAPHYFSLGCGKPFVCPICFLTTVHTKELLQWLNASRRCGGSYDPFYDGLGYSFSVKLLKNELAKREHIPNKKEAKEIRRQKAKRGC